MYPIKIPRGQRGFFPTLEAQSIPVELRGGLLVNHTGTMWGTNGKKIKIKKTANADLRMHYSPYTNVIFSSPSLPVSVAFSSHVASHIKCALELILLTTRFNHGRSQGSGPWPSVFSR